MFKNLVMMEPTGITPYGMNELKKYAQNITTYSSVPSSDEEIVKRIQDADAVLISYTSVLSASVIEKAHNLKYIGMCCSLYDEKSANVDIAYSRKNGITVTGVRDYGDNGVIEYVLHELTGILHGYDKKMWDDEPTELGSLSIGVLGLGTTGGMLADTLHNFTSKISYYSRTRKTQFEDKGIKYLPLHDLLKISDVILCCLNKNVTLLGKEEFALMSGKKMLFNTSIGPAFSGDDLEEWLKQSNEHYFFCDSASSAGKEAVLKMDNTVCRYCAGGKTKECADRLSSKVIDNIVNFLNK